MALRLFLFSLLGSFSLWVAAQTGSVKGRVLDARTGVPLAYAQVSLEGTSAVTTTDSLGEYLLEKVRPGFYRLSGALIGFERTASAEFQVQGNRIAYVDLELSEAIYQLKAAVARPASTLKKKESPVSFYQLGIQQIEKSAGANRDISKLVQTLPGVAATAANRNDLNVRGGGSSENVFYLDGIELPVINHFATQGASGGVVGILNPDFISHIDFYTGAFPANRGNALSSVMDIRMKEGDREKVNTKLSIGASDAAFTVNGPLGKHSTFIASARQSYLQALFKVVGLPFLPTYNDFQFKIHHAPSARHQFSLIGLGSIDNMRLNTDLATDGTEVQRYILNYLPVYSQWHYTVGFSYKYLAERYTDTWVLSRNMLRNESYKHPDNNTALPRLSNYRSDEAENKARFERTYWSLPIKLQWGVGVQHTHYTNDTHRQVFRGGKATEERYATTLHLWSYQAFTQASKALRNEQLKLSLGIHWSGNTYHAAMRNPLRQMSPRFSVSYALTEQLDLSANVGHYAQRPAYTILGVKGQDGNFLNRHHNTRYLTSDQVVAGIDFHPSESLRFTVEGFYKGYRHYPISVQEGVSLASKGGENDAVGDEAVLSIGKGRAYGFEAVAKLLSWRHIDFTATYTFFRSEFTDKQGHYVPSSWDTRHVFNLIGSYRFGKSWNVAMRWRYVGGAPYTPIDEVLSTDKAAWALRQRAYWDYSRFNSLRLAAAHQLDVRIDKEFYFNKWTMNCYVDVQNAYKGKASKPPIYTNLDEQGRIMDDPNDPQRQRLRTLDYFSHTLIPTIGFIVQF